MKFFLASIVLCLCLTTQPASAARYYDNSEWKDFPFIEMMAAMMRIMNDMMSGGSSNYYYPGLGMLPYASGMGNLPMSPTGMSGMPFYNNPWNSNPLLQNWQNGLMPGSDVLNSGLKNNLWNSGNRLNGNAKTLQNYSSSGMNGIWQALSGDVLVIYHNNHFIWSDGNKRNLAGRLVIQGNQLIAYIPASNTTLNFQFYRDNNKFIVKDKSSQTYTFTKIY